MLPDTPGPEPSRVRWAMLWLLAAIAVILLGWALRATASVCVPVVFAFFLALIVYPLDRIAAERLPRGLRWLGHVLAISVVVLALVVFFGCLWFAAQQLVDRFQDADYTQLLQSIDLPDAQSNSSAMRGRLSNATQTLASAAVEWISGFAQGAVNAAGATLAGLLVVLFLILMMLIEAPRWQAKLEAIASSRTDRDIRHSLFVIAARLRRYLLTRTILGIATAGLYTIWLWIFDLDLLVVWALLAFLLNFVPTIGSMIAGGLAVAFAFVQKDLSTAFAIGAGLFAIEQVMGNFLDPRIQGKQVSVSPLIILIVLVFWTWAWGPVGAILAVPVVVAIIILFSHIGPLRPVALFLSEEGNMADLDHVTDGAVDTESRTSW